jgi:hypothetical protein
MRWDRSSIRKGLRPVVVVGVAVGTIVLVAHLAAAALWLSFDPTSASPGTKVNVRLEPEGLLSQASGAELPLYMTDTRTWTLAFNLRGSSLEALKRDQRVASLESSMLVDGQGDAEATFVVPKVNPGIYMVLFACDVCPPYFGGEVYPGGEFEILHRALVYPSL